MTGQLNGKTALIIGGTSGIGRAAAVLFAREGAQVVVSGRRQAEGDALVKEINAIGGQATFIQSDVSRAADVNAAVQKSGRLDIAFNNAGVNSTPKPLAEQTEEDWDHTVDINLKGVWLAMKYEIPQMLNNGGGAIVNTSSVGGLVGNYNISPYIASKHGVVGLTKAAALDYAKQNIRVNAIAPAGTETAMLNEWLPADEAKQQLTQAHPIGRIASPEEVAKAALSLCSDAASFVTGQTLAVDGGYTTQ